MEKKLSFKLTQVDFIHLKKICDFYNLNYSEGLRFLINEYFYSNCDEGGHIKKYQ